MLVEWRNVVGSSVIKSIRNIRSRIFIDLNPDYKATIFIAGVGRSGTTWISDIINYANEYRDIFEPFHPYQVDICKNFRYRQYLRPTNQHEDFIEPAKAILSGKVRNKWMDSLNRKVVCRKRLVKDIRANLLLKWIHVNFPGIPTILVLRHPCAVAISKIQLNWDTHLEEFLAQGELMEDFLNPFRREIEKAQTIFDKHVFLWCIENYVPLRQFKRGEIHLAFYENFCERPEYEIDRLFSFLGKVYDERVLAVLRSPSSQSRKESSIIVGDSLIDSWRKQVNDKQLERIVEILSLFGLDRIYSRDSMPNIDNTYDMMGAN